MGKLEKFCIFTPIKILAISSLCIFAMLFLMDRLEPGDLWRTKDGSILMDDLGLWLHLTYNLICCLGLITISLNLIRRVRNNEFLSFLTFLAPLVVFYIYYCLHVGFLVSAEFIRSLLLFPLVVLLVFYYVQFRLRVRKGYFEKEELTLNETSSAHENN